MSRIGKGGMYLGYTCAQKAPYEELEALQFRLYDDQLEIRLRIHIARLVLNKFNLSPIVSSRPKMHS
jgi:hypothetical protein